MCESDAIIISAGLCDINVSLFPDVERPDSTALFLSRYLYCSQQLSCSPRTMSSDIMLTGNQLVPTFFGLLLQVDPSRFGASALSEEMFYFLRVYPIVVTELLQTPSIILILELEA